MENSDLSVSDSVVQAVAVATDTDPLELPPLYETVDPDALETLVGQLADGEVSLVYAETAVTVKHTGQVRVGDRSVDRSPDHAPTKALD